MNDKTATRAQAEQLSNDLTATWNSLDWTLAEKEVNRLQIRIGSATEKKNWNAVKDSNIY